MGRDARRISATPSWEEFGDSSCAAGRFWFSVLYYPRNKYQGKVKEYVYQKAHAAENHQQLIAEEAEFTVCTDDELRHISP